MNKSEHINELVSALAKAQAEMPSAKKDSKNPFFNSSYADLHAVWEACRDTLTKHGLAVIQTCGGSGGEFSVTTMLAHTSGQWVSGTLSMRMDKVDPQKVGSLMSYFRRYGLMAIAGISTADDDGEEAMQRHPKESYENAKAPVLDEGENIAFEELPKEKPHAPIGVTDTSKVEVGKYAGKTYQWVAENDITYITNYVKKLVANNRASMHPSLTHLYDWAENKGIT